MTNLDRVLKSRDITLPTKVWTAKAMIFSSNDVQMWELDHKEGWALKNWCFQILMLEKTLKSPLEARRSNQSKSTLNIHWKDCGWSRSSNSLATWCEEPTYWKRLWCRERLKAKGEQGNRGWRWLNGIIDLMDMHLSKLQQIVKDREAWCVAVHGGAAKSWTRLNNWTRTTTPSLWTYCHLVLVYVL